MILAKLVEYLKSNSGPHKTAQMAKAVGANKNTCRRMMGELRQLGMAQIVGQDGMECLWQWIEPEAIVKERIVEKRVPFPVEKFVEKLVEKPTGYVFLQSAGEGETTPESLKRQHEYILRYLRAKREHFDKLSGPKQRSERF